jgi:hypothetical protein
MRLVFVEWGLKMVQYCCTRGVSRKQITDIVSSVDPLGVVPAAGVLRVVKKKRGRERSWVEIRRDKEERNGASSDRTAFNVQR